MNFIDELKRRKVFKVAAVYAVVAWLLIQVAATVFPSLQLPTWTVTFVTVLFILGFPIAVILSWAYDVTPQGIKTDAEIQASQNNVVITSNATDRKLIYAILAMVVLVVGFQVYDRFIQPSNATISTTKTNNANNKVLRAMLPVETLQRRFIGTYINSFHFSPDGNQIAYAAWNNGKAKIYLQDLDRLAPRVIRETDIAFQPALAGYSPDGRRLIYYTQFDQTLVALDIANGIETILANNFNTNVLQTMGWQDVNTLFYFQSREFKTINIISGEIKSLNLPFPANEKPIRPSILPGGKWLLYTSVPTDFVLPSDTLRRTQTPVVLLNLHTGEKKQLLDHGWEATYVASGHIIYNDTGSIWAVAFDADKGALVGYPTIIQTGIEFETSYNVVAFGVSSTGRMAYLPGGDTSGNNAEIFLPWTLRNRHSGEEQPLLLPAKAWGVSFSPDGTKLSFTVGPNSDSDIWTYSLKEQRPTKLSFAGNASFPLWSPDSKKIYYASKLDTNHQELMVKNADGSGKPVALLSEQAITLSPSAITLNGEQLLYNVVSPGPRAKMRAVNLRQESLAQDLFDGETENSFEGKLHPSGQLLAYTWTDNVQANLFVVPYPNVNTGKWQLGDNVGLPRWAENGNALYYINIANNSIERVGVDNSSGPTFGPAETLVEDVYLGIVPLNIYDISPDGEWIVYRSNKNAVTNNSTSPAQIILVDNWFVELNRLASPDPKYQNSTQ